MTYRKLVIIKKFHLDKTHFISHLIINLSGHQISNLLTRHNIKCKWDPDETFTRISSTRITPYNNNHLVFYIGICYPFLKPRAHNILRYQPNCIFLISPRSYNYIGKHVELSAESGDKQLSAGSVWLRGRDCPKWDLAPFLVDDQGGVIPGRDI
jgi:hypothetical protein